MNFLQLGEMVLKFAKSGEIRASDNLSAIDYANYLKLASANLIASKKISQQDVTYNTPAPIDVDINDGIVKIPKDINKGYISAIKLLSSNGNVVCNHVSRIKSSQAPSFCTSAFKHFYVTGDTIQLINVPSDAKKIRLYQNMSTDLKSEVSDEVAYIIVVDAIKLAKAIDEKDNDNTVDNASIKNLVNQQLKID